MACCSAPPPTACHPKRPGVLRVCWRPERPQPGGNAWHTGVAWLGTTIGSRQRAASEASPFQWLYRLTSAGQMVTRSPINRVGCTFSANALLPLVGYEDHLADVSSLGDPPVGGGRLGERMDGVDAG